MMTAPVTSSSYAGGAYSGGLYSASTYGGTALRFHGIRVGTVAKAIANRTAAGTVRALQSSFMALAGNVGPMWPAIAVAPCAGFWGTQIGIGNCCWTAAPNNAAAMFPGA